MLKEIQKKIIKIDEAAGLEIVFSSVKEYKIYLVIVSASRGKLTKQSIPHLKDLKKLSSHIKNSIPVFIVLNGKGILTKIFPDKSDTLSAEALLPGINPNDFYIEIRSKERIISLIRKDQANQMIRQIQEEGYKVLGFAFGFSSIFMISGFIPLNEYHKVETSTFNLEFDDDRNIINIGQLSEDSQHNNPGKEYNIGDLYLRSHEILSFAAATQLLADDLITPSLPENNIIEQNRKDFKNQKLYKASLIVILTFVLSMLLVNFFIFNHYFTENQKISTSKSLSEQQILKINLIKRDLNNKESFLTAAGWTQQTRVSLIADRIASMVSSGTLLTTMNIHPAVINNFSDAVNTQFKKDTIQITGQCENASEVNQFINNLKNISFIENVVVKNYAYKKEIETGIFLLEIITN